MISSFIRRHYWWLLPLLIADIFLFRWLYLRSASRDVPVPVADPPSVETDDPVGRLYGYPTAQTNLWMTDDATVYMPTASGRVESALYGSVRTVQRAGRVLSSFHEGIDIAPLERDRAGRPRDAVLAVADGRVAYINPVAGNSTYGIYVVLAHPDRVGEIFTLYAHLASVATDLEATATVRRGQRIGRMGNTASSGLPMARAHLHFEIGVINNRRFDAWYRRQQLVPDHGMWHGWNLTGIDPLALYGRGDAQPRFCMADYLGDRAPAFLLIQTADRLPDYFTRYPPLWRGAPYAGGAMVMAVSEGGVPLWGRTATADEQAHWLRQQPVAVMTAHPVVLGRNGLRLVVSRGESWILGAAGERWLDIMNW